MNISSFRSAFPEFSNTDNYPDSMITFWSELAETQLVEENIGNIYGKAVMLFTAHELVLARNNVQDSSLPGGVGGGTGLVSSESLGGASVSYDTGGTSERDAGHFNLTTYGKQLARIISLGAVCKVFGANSL